MKYLLDVNALIAFGFLHHQFHARLIQWLSAEVTPQLLSTSITELGFVRVLAQAPGAGISVSEAKTLLLQLKKNRVVPLTFVPDGNDISMLPAWAKAPKQTTDGHLVRLAAAHSARLATFDGAIPGAFLIPA